MRLSLSRHGGLAAGVLMRRPPVVADTDDLPPDAAAQVESMVEEAKKSVPDSPPPEPHPDAMSYTITIEHDGSKLTLKGSDRRMSPAFRLLLDWLERHKRGG